MAAKTAARQAEGKGGEPGQKSVTVNQNNTTGWAKNQVNSCLDAALHYESLGFYILPIIPGTKRPYVKWIHRSDSRPSPDEIKAWFNEYPDAQIGTPAGLSGLTSLDFDSLGDMHRFRETVSDVDSPFSIATGRDGGGCHRLFKAVPDLQKKMVKVGGFDIDLLVRHQLQLLPPSIHKSGRSYKWEGPDPLEMDPETFRDELPDLPSAAVAFFKGCAADENRLNSDGKSPNLDPELILQGVDDGERDNTIFRYACRLRGKNLSLSEARTLILKAAAACRPPFPEKEALAKLSQAYKFEAGAGAETTGQKFKLVKLSDIELRKPDYLIYGMMEVDSTVCIFSPPSEAKTFFAIDASCCVANGKDFHGRAVKQGPVVFIAGEGQNGLKRRFSAWEIRHQVDLDQAPIFISTMPAGLCDAEQVDHVIDAVQLVADEYGNPVLVVLDTVARNFGPGDENSTKDMTAFINGADKIRQRFRSCILLVHHSGHADRSRGRGSMALKGGVDVEYRLEKDETGVVRVTHAKPPKDFDPPPPMAFRLNTVELPYTDDQGNPVTSAILDEIEYQPPETIQGKKGRGKWQTASIKILKELHEQHQKNLTARGYNPEDARVKLNDWRNACYDAGMSREAWRRIKDSLNENSDVFYEHGYVQFIGHNVTF